VFQYGVTGSVVPASLMNVAAVTQSGGNNASVVVQVGRGNFANVVQQ
jgi:hypothetical protein